TLQQASSSLEEIQKSNGTLAKLVKSDEAHQEVVTLVKETQALVRQGQDTFRQTQETMRKGEEALAAVKQDADAIKRMPIVRNYVEDQFALLHRPDQDRDRRSYHTEHLFEPGKSVLTEEGKRHLSNLAPWFAEHSNKGSDIVVVTYAAPPI